MELAKQVKMTNKTNYAIICSTEEQARECEGKYKLGFIESEKDIFYIMALLHKGYTIITYEEALEKNLLGEKVPESPSEDNLVDYKSLLQKYIHHIDKCEGTNYIGDGWGLKFTQEENDILNKLYEMPLSSK